MLHIDPPNKTGNHVVSMIPTTKNAQDLDISEKVAVYVKLPGSFLFLPRKYNPDWAIAFTEGSVKYIYFL